MATSTWNVSANGDWSDASDWSGGVPNGSSATATITESGTYTVDIASTETFSVGSVTVNDAGATLEVDGTLNLANTLTLSAGNLDLTGTINGGTINSGGGTFSADGATLNGATVDGTINVNGNSTLGITGTLTLAGTDGSGPGTIDIAYWEGAVVFSASGSLTNAIVNFDGIGGSSVYAANGGTLTIAANTTINASEAALGGSDTLGAFNSGSVINRGTINAGAPDHNPESASLTVLGGTFDNIGTIAVSNGDAFDISTTNFSNTGTITVDGKSELEFAAPVLTADLGTIDAQTGATIDFNGTLMNQGATFDMVSGVIVGGTISGGTIAGTLAIAQTSPYDDASLVLADSPTLTGANGSGPGTIELNQYDSLLGLTGTETIDNATINIGADAYGATIFNFGSGVVTFGSHLTITQTQGSSNAYIGQNSELEESSGTIVNKGSIDAAAPSGHFDIYLTGFTNSGSLAVSNNGVMTLDVGDFTNTGTISVTTGGTLCLNVTTFQDTGTISIDGTSTLSLLYTLTTANLAALLSDFSFASGATLEFATLDNTGATLNLPAGLQFAGEIVGGTIEGTLDLSAANASLQLGGDVSMVGAGGSGPGSINVSGFDSVLTLDGPGTLENATISLAAGMVLQNSTLASTVTVSQTANGSYASISGPGSLDGTIDAAASGGTFVLDDRNDIPPGQTLTNAGTIAVTNGDTLEIDPVGYGPTFMNTGTISVDGSSKLIFDDVTTADLGTILASPGATIDFSSPLRNAGATFDVPSGVVLEGTISGGTIAGTINLSSASQQLTLTDDIAMTGAGGTGPGTIDITGSGAELILTPTTTLANATIHIGAASAEGAVIDNGPDGVVTFATSLTVEQTGSGTAAFIGEDANLSPVNLTGTLVNDGIIIAGVSGSAMGVDPATLTNAGLVEASNGGEVLVGSNDFTNLPGSTLTGGSYEAAAGGTFEFVALTTVVTDDATIILSGASATMDELNPTTNAKETIQSTLTSTGTSGALEILGGADWTQSTAFTNAGTIQLGGGTFQVSSLTSSGMIDGFGTVGEAVSNTGALVALGGTLNVEDGSLSGYSGGALSTVTLGAGANATLQLPGNVSITTLDSMIELTGVGAAIQSLNGSAEVTVQSTLKTIAASGTLIVGDSYSSSNAIANAGTIQMAGGTLSTGTLTDSTGSNLNGYGTVASVFDDSGSVTSSTGALVFTGTDDTFAGTLGGQQIDFGGGTDTVQNGASLTAGTIAITGNASVTFAASESYAGTLALGAGTLNLGANALTLSGTGSTIAGTISGTGALTFSGGSQTINSGAALSMSSWTLSGSDATTVNTSLSYAGAFSAGAGTTLTMASGDKLTLTGTTSFAGATSGAGKLALSGGTETFDSGASFGSGLVLEGTAEAGVSGSVTISGALTEGASTALTIASGDTLTLSGKGSSIAGAVTGSGTLALSGGTDMVSRGASLGISDIVLSSGAALSFGTSFSYAGLLNEAAGTTLALGAYTFNLSGTGSTISGAITGTAGLTFSGGSQAINSGATLATAHWSLTGSDTVSLNENLTTGGSFAGAAGTSLTIASGDTLTLNGTSAFTGKVQGTGATLAFTSGSQTFNSGASLAVSNWMLSGSASTSLTESLSYAGTFSAGAGTALNIALNDTLTLTGAASFAGAISGGGTLALSGNSDTFDAGAHFSSKMSLRSGALVTVNGGVSVSGVLTENTGAAIAIGAGATLTLSGSGSALIGTVDGAGTLALSGGTDSLWRGLSLGVADLALSSGVTASLDTSLAYTGEFSTAAGTTLALGAYTLGLSGAGSIFSGTISGSTGALSLTGGSQAFDSGAAMTEGRWAMSGSDTASVNEKLTFGGTYSEGAGTTLTIASGETLSLTGVATLGATVNGSGTLALSNATLSGLVAGGTVTLDDAGTIVQTGQITLGDASSNAATLTIASSATYKIEGNVGIGIGASSSSVIDDNGLLIKNGGTGTSNIAVGIIDNGHIEVSTGTLDLAQGLTGTGAMQVDAGATLEFGASAASTLTMAFNGANATLALASPSSFAATISDFAAGDKVDLLAIKATSAVLEANDQLLITNSASTIATLQLTGTYTGYTFATVSDGHGGTDITATAPQSHATVEFDTNDALAAATLRQFDSHLADWHLG